MHIKITTFRNKINIRSGKVYDKFDDNYALTTMVKKSDKPGITLDFQYWFCISWKHVKLCSWNSWQ